MGRKGLLSYQFLSNSQGFILISSLLILTILALLVLSFVALSTRDLELAKRHEQKTKALYLAISGIEYYIAKGLPEAVTPDSTPRIYPEENENHLCELKIEGNILYSRGMIKDPSGGIICEESLLSPLKELGNIYEVSSITQEGKNL